ncbi:MAG: serine/threonine protein kinase [Chloroflexi bacterium]|nr:serine/threonine protein kinase [Chloroflexota bacterium]
MAENQDDASRSSRNPTDLTGTTLGKYRLIEKLGQGGMAQVYKAYQLDLERYVAIKILHPHLTGDEEFAARFQREARAIAALEHPHSVRVYDFDTDHDLAFIVMEYLTGASLKARLRDLSCRNEFMELAQVAHIIGALADALDYAHAHGVIHRDIKPSNVLLATDGRPVLTDFGIAKMIDATIITGSSGSLGTPAYISPEQAKGEPGDARSDIYALGVMLYQLCTNHLPFDADTPYAIILKHLTAPLPPPRTLRPDLPDAIERVILKSLAKDPDDRYQTAGEMGQAIRAAIAPAANAGRARFSAPGKSALNRLRAHLSNLSRRTLLWQGAALIAMTLLICIVLFWISIPWRAQRYLTRLTLTPVSEIGVTMLTLEGADAIVDTWLDPDKPDEIGQAAERARLRSADKADRILIGFSASRLPPEANVISATLTLRVEAQTKSIAPCRIVAFRMATPWRPGTATYNSPWSAPGLMTGVDYDSTAADRVTLPESGSVALNLTQTIAGWQKRGRAGGGLVLMLSDDSHPQCQYWVYTTEQTDPAKRPVVRISYKEQQ